MGAWGAGLYADDTACDVRDDYVRLLRQGHASEEATAIILGRFPDLAANRPLECLVVLPLADTQWKYGRLTLPVKERALALLSTGGDLSVWEADAPSDAGARRKVLQKLAAQLGSTLPPPKPVQVRPPPGEKPKKVRMTAPVGTVFLLPVGETLHLPLVLLGYRELEESIEPLFCIFPTPIDPASKFSADALGGTPLGLHSGSGPQSVFGAFPGDERKNPYKHLQAIGMAQDMPLPSVPASPTFYSFGGMVSRAAETWRLRSGS